MRLVEQVTLHLQEGRSDKVYEVNLCEVGDDQFVVNFRYGRRGSTLREGTKTQSPVSEAKARAVCDKLVASKEKKGYQRRAEASETSTAPPPAPAAPDRAPLQEVRNAALLKLLAQGDRGERPLDRVIWRVGELGLREAEPLLLELMEAQSPANMRSYCLVYALGRCGGRASVPALENARSDRRYPVMTHSMAEEALLHVDEAAAKRIRSDLVQRLPEPLRDALGAKDPDRFQGELLAAVRRRDAKAAAILSNAYRVGGEVARPGVLAALREVPLQRDLFQGVRAVFKAAEFRRDAEVFGLLAYRFEKTPAGRTDPWEPDKRVFANNTKRYLRRRAARTLRRLGELGSDDFVPMAVGVLLPFGEDDAGTSRRGVYETWNYNTDTSSRSSLKWDRYARYWAFNTILYGNSPRYQPDRGGKAWRCKAGYEPGQPAPDVREELYPELWTAKPAALLHLIDESGCEVVHEMAARALRGCTEFCAALEADALVMLLGARFDVSARLGLDLVKMRTLDTVLATGLIRCRLQEARALAHEWLRRQIPQSFEDTNLWATLIGSGYSDNREFARSQLRAANVPAGQAQVIIARVIAALKDLGEHDAERIADVARTLQAVFGEVLRTIGEEIVRDLLSHPLLAVQEFGADLLLNHRRLAASVPEDLLIALLDSEHASIRTVGTKLLDKLPDIELRSHPELFIHLATHELGDLRAGCRATIARLAQADTRFGETVAKALADALMRSLPKGVPADLVIMLRVDLGHCLPAAERAETMRLLKAKSPHARELGALYLARLNAEELELFDIVTLASNELLSVRQGSWTLCEASVERFKIAMPALARLLDARWADSREFAYQFVRERFGRDDLGPAVLVAICDSVRPDVQRFGRDLIVKNFRDEDGQEYLAKLSEHPAVSLQLFVTNYLERYASDNPERLSSLSHYFLSVLSRVNRGGVAKRRCLAFLAEEGLKSADAARTVAGILTRQSVTVAIGNKASCIEAMMALRAKYPELEVPIRVLEPEVRGAV